MKQRKDKRKYKGALKLMTRSRHIADEFIWVQEHEIKAMLPFSWRLVKP